MRRFGILLAIMASVATACTAADDSNETTTTIQATTSTTETPATTTQSTAGGVVMVADSSFGSILVDGDGNTLYLFMPDNQGESVCYDECEATWPPLVDDVQPGDGIDAALIGSAARTDGSDQVTYNGWPLYYFANDAAPGDTNGQGINDVWYVVDPQGDPIGQPEAAAGLDGY
jgi:predicted lipoprotein with Yx(FWY)xxD motif